MQFYEPSNSSTFTSSPYDCMVKEAEEQLKEKEKAKSEKLDELKKTLNQVDRLIEGFIPS